MSFELKSIGTQNCPRCNAIAQLRIDIRKTDNKWIPIYIVCKVCRLKRYMFTKTRREIEIDRRIGLLRERANEFPQSSVAIQKRIDELTKLKIRHL